MIVFHSVSKIFGSRLVLDHVTLRIEPGEFVCITGPSGAGKSTFLSLLIRAEVPTEGKIEADGIDLAVLPPSILQLYRRRTGVVFQDYKLLSDRTVYENVAFAMEVCGDDDATISRRVPDILKKVGLVDRMNAFPRELSGGEKARAALARALVHHPMILIADEPTGNIDPKQSMEILALLRQLHSEGTTVILASHDQQIIDALQTRVIRLEEGKIIRDAVGGYDAGRTSAPVAESNRTTSPIQDARKHQIFDKPKRPDLSFTPPSATSSPSFSSSTSSIPPAEKAVTSSKGKKDLSFTPPSQKEKQKTSSFETNWPTPNVTMVDSTSESHPGHKPKKEPPPEEKKNPRIRPIGI